VIIPEVLKTAHYTSHIVGKWHLGHEKPFLPVAQGFDTFFGLIYANNMKPLDYWRQDQIVTDEKVDMDHITQRYTKEAIDVITKNKDHPFFLYFAHTMTHVPLGASENFKGKSAGGLYGDAAEEIDWSVGQVIKTLKEQNLEDNTLVIYTSDNGPWHIKGEDGGNAFPLRAGKGTSYEGGVRVPCIMRWPGHIPANTVNHEIAGFIDMLPTFAHLAGADKAVPTDRVIDGKDISPMLLDPGAKSPHDYWLYYAAGRLNAVRQGKWKLKLETTLKEETEYDKVKNPMTPIDPKLYNLSIDPAEQKSVAQNHPDIVEKLNKIADQARQDIGDTRNNIEGRNSRPVGAIDAPMPNTN
jgi:arylsulfatase